MQRLRTPVAQFEQMRSIDCSHASSDSLRASSLQGRKVAILVTEGIEQVELTDPRKALDGAGATIQVVSPKEGEVRGMNHTELG